MRKSLSLVTRPRTLREVLVNEGGVLKERRASRSLSFVSKRQEISEALRCVVLIMSYHLAVVFLLFRSEGSEHGINFHVGLCRWITRTIERYWRRLNVRGLCLPGKMSQLLHCMFLLTRAGSHSYRFVHISHTIRALQSSTKTSLRIEAEGLLSLQFLVPVPKAKGGGSSDSFIEFRVRAIGTSRGRERTLTGFPSVCHWTRKSHDQTHHSHVFARRMILPWTFAR